MRIRAAVAVVLLLAGCTPRLSTDWSAADTLLVVRQDNQRLLVGIDAHGGRVLPLAVLPGEAGTGSALDTALIAADGRTLVLSGEGFAANVLSIDGGVRDAGKIEAGLYPVLAGTTLVGVGPGRSAVTYRDLREIGRAIWDEQVVGGDGRCTVGTIGVLPKRSAVLRRGTAPAIPLGAGTVPLGVSCDSDRALVSVTSDALDAPSRALLVRGTTVTPVDVGPNPRALRLLDGGLAAVDVERDGQRVIRIVDLATGRVRHEAPVRGTSQVSSIDVTRQGTVVVAGGRTATIIDSVSGAFSTVELPGESLVYLSRQ